MTPMSYLRKSVLKVTQAEMARITGTNQGTVSRWETGTLAPNVWQLRAIKDAAIACGAEWNDSWLLDVPAPAPSTQAAE